LNIKSTTLAFNRI